MKDNELKCYDVAVAGGGASGMMAAIMAARAGATVVLFEFNDMLGKKILATGNGRCNYTNRSLDLSNYYGASKVFLEQAFLEFSEEQTECFFEELGILSMEKDGLLYPRSRQAKSICDVLRLELLAFEVDIRYNCQVKRIAKEGESFDVTLADKQIFHAKNVILACGGKASSIRGSKGDGYYLAQCLGHHIIPQVPALVQLRANDDRIQSASGVRCEAGVTTYIDGDKKCHWQGELQITNYGISGIVIFQSSRLASYALEQGKDVTYEIDFLPEYDGKTLEDLVRRLFYGTKTRKRAEEALIGLLPDALVQVILRSANIMPGQWADEVSGEQLERLQEALCSYRIKVTDTNGFANAQVTAGGIDTEEINPQTMESRLVPGLFFAGELVDVDGICGGYNLQWAWTSGAIAGRLGKRNDKWS